MNYPKTRVACVQISRVSHLDVLPALNGLADEHVLMTEVYKLTENASTFSHVIQSSISQINTLLLHVKLPTKLPACHKLRYENT